jgi:hypothetical protein
MRPDQPDHDRKKLPISSMKRGQVAASPSAMLEAAGQSR